MTASRLTTDPMSCTDQEMTAIRLELWGCEVAERGGAGDGAGGELQRELLRGGPSGVTERRY